MGNKRFIVHVDMDAFFAAVEQRDNPSLLGKAVVVGADPRSGKGRGVVSTCSYEARRFGIHSAMPISAAYKRCPHAVFLPVDISKYVRVSRQIYSILYSFTPDLEAVSIDEAFLDITGSHHLFGGPRNAAILIKSRIKKETGLTASVGLAPTKMAAKIASDLLKPDGFVEVTEKGLLGFLWPLDISKMWGVGKKSEGILRDMGIRKIGDLASEDPDRLKNAFGVNGLRLWNLANGLDEREVKAESEAKSVSNEVTFNTDIDSKEIAESVLMTLCEKVSDRLRSDNLEGRTVTLKIRLGNFKTYTRSVSRTEASNFTDMLYKEVKSLYNRFGTKGRKVRLLGVKVSGISRRAFKTSLFSNTCDTKIEDAHKAVEKIKKKFGRNSIHRASSNMRQLSQ
ncbi:MAG: DNA polymerase IV [Candidatus Omnitrophica bacterium]|nr:DNA polymerase IV [Candidatus Omnitrophota bacterium]